VRIVIICAAALVGLSGPATAQIQPHHDSISVAFAIDGKPTRCTAFSVELRFDGEVIRPNLAGQHFDIPDVFKKPPKQWRDDQHVDISLSCDGQTLVFPQQHPAFISAGDWELGIARPPYAIERFRRSFALEHGAWLGYLIFEGEPGVVTFAPQPDPPVDLVNSMRREQPDASGERARNIAYALAVFGFEYERNRDYLLLLLHVCLARPNESPEDEECDRELLDFITNLYWRGDDSLLAPLLRLADPRRDVIGEIGTFYSDLLDRRGAVGLESIEKLPPEKQTLSCKLAYEDDLSTDSPKRDRIIAFLKGTGGEAANRCSSALGGS
jgi:hypothetical protein